MFDLVVLSLFISAPFAAALPYSNHGFAERGVAFTSLPVTTSYESTVTPIQSAQSTLEAGTTGILNTALGTDHAPNGPFATAIPTTVGVPSPATTDFSVANATPTAATSANVFVSIRIDEPPVRSRSDHPVQQLGIVNQTEPTETNKFYANFFLGSQNQGTWTHPYSLSWSKGGGNTHSWGLSVSHVERSQFAYGPGDPVEYFVAPVGIQYMVFSAEELNSTTTQLTTDTLQGFSANVNLLTTSGAEPLVTFPVIQGMGFVTAVYNGAKPWIESGVFFRTLTYAGPLAGNSTYKYRVTLMDNSNWLLYITPSGSVGNVPLTLNSTTLIQGPAKFNGIIQVAKNPAGDSGEATYDSSAGAYAESATISGSVDGTTGSYTLEWKNAGLTGKPLLMFALPHHVASFDAETAGKLTSIELMTTTKGMAKAIQADKMTMAEADLPTGMMFGPWSPFATAAEEALPDQETSLINAIGTAEMAQNMTAQCILDSMYYSGKGLAKFATLLYTLQDLAGNTKIGSAGLAVLEDVFNVFVNNTQPFPLVYDTVWKGAVSEASYLTGNSGYDFGNSYYNDHHFHYGYFVYAAAVIAYLDAEWMTRGNNKAWVEMLIRDYANPISDDPYFPFSRSFDWFHGHSWAKGLFESGDGKDEESSSEDVFATYALKMWGEVVGDPNLAARSTLQLAVQKRSLQSYFLYESNNTVQPPQFIGNKVSGILFENKIHHTTYFGGNTEYIQGIHMIPISPASVYTRSRTFVQEEWDHYFSNVNGTDRIASIAGGWKGILMANYATLNQTASYDFFASGTPGAVIKRNTDVEELGKRQADGFDVSWLDGGASRAWYLAWAAKLATLKLP